MKKCKKEKLTVRDDLVSSAKSDVGRMVDSGQADDRRLIRLVRDRQLLYARNNMPVASYYTQVKRLWDEVAREMGWTVADVRRKWSHIRNSYSRHLRNEMHGACTSKGRMVSKWYLADDLEFLREHMATDTRSAPYPTFATSFLEMDIGESQNSDSLDVKPFISNPWFPLNSAPLPFDHKAHSEDSSSSHAFTPDENSSYFQFFRGIYNDYQELSASKQRQFKRQCLTYLHELLDEEEQNRNRFEQSDALNLSNSNVCSEDEPDSKVFVGENGSP
ncbi:uncharacterized protein LOC119840252 [Zerene cesonia]|uniref:uncharacterized protein LOC119840252 n=1 Tax=Zerene cesonia TaxID=33412 RepID=UPI0018E5508E|nr:uncharacterized protein LOC119840252 [Zerene cesonia]